MMKPTRAAAGRVAIALGAALAMAHAAVAADNLSELRAMYTTLQNRLLHNQFQRPVYLDSSETSDAVTGSIYALLTYGFSTVGAALKSSANWCDILLLHLNTKHCTTSSAGEEVLTIIVGKKYDRPLDEGYRMAFAYRVARPTSNYMQIALEAEKGPLSTRNYHILVEAIPLENGQTFLHFSYSYAYGLAGRFAMQTYLLTTGKDKVGFTETGTRPDGSATYIGGMRGVVERNTMRYYLAIEAFLGALSEPPPARLEKRLYDWFAAVEQYPRQLHELDISDYLTMKRKEYSASARSAKP
jgi:hypothetical protein